MRIRKGKCGFTLVELLVVIAIISILAGLLLPALEQALGAARTTSCLSQHRQMYLAGRDYAEDYGLYPIKESTGYASSADKLVVNGYMQSFEQLYCPDVTVTSDFNWRYNRTLYSCNGYLSGYLRSSDGVLVTAPLDPGRVTHASQVIAWADNSIGHHENGQLYPTNTFSQHPYDSSQWNDLSMIGAEHYWLGATFAYRHAGIPIGVFMDGHGESRPAPWEAIPF
jgi:prepilin-type N-terminal cleavage/methylation domain-containing protein